MCVGYAADFGCAARVEVHRWWANLPLRGLQNAGSRCKDPSGMDSGATANGDAAGLWRSGHDRYMVWKLVVICPVTVDEAFGNLRKNIRFWNLNIDREGSHVQLTSAEHSEMITANNNTFIALERAIFSHKHFRWVNWIVCRIRVAFILSDAIDKNRWNVSIYLINTLSIPWNW